MMRAPSIRARVVLAALLGYAGVAGAQTANASTAATGLGGAYTARAQGYNAVNWNPANLAMPGNPGFSFTTLAIDGNAGIKPIDFNKLAEYSGKDIPAAVREQWLLDVEAAGGEKGALGGGITALGLSIGSLALQVNTKVAGDVNLPPGAIEALFFGNAGRTGTVKSLDMTGAAAQAAAYSTAAVSYGMRLPMVPLGNFAIGATGKYIVGHGLVVGAENGSNFGTSSMNYNFSYVGPDSASLETANVGKGMGLDLGGAWTLPGFRFGVSVQNIVNTFKWDTTMFEHTQVQGAWDPASDPTDTTITSAYNTAPVALREKVAGLKFKPVLAAGLSFDWLPRITVSADIRQQVGGGIEVGPESIIGAGAELRLIPFIPLRGGVQMMSGGFGMSGGLGIRLLGFEAGVAGYVRKRDGGSESGITLNAISIRP